MYFRELHNKYPFLSCHLSQFFALLVSRFVSLAVFQIALGQGE